MANLDIPTMRATFTGQRIRFIAHLHPDPQPLTAGEEGVCLGVDDIGNLLMRWDSGRGLNLTADGDAYAIVSPEPAG